MGPLWGPAFCKTHPVSLLTALANIIIKIYKQKVISLKKGTGRMSWLKQISCVGRGGASVELSPKFHQVLTVHQIENHAKIPPNKVYPAVYVNISGQ
jgi:hypothetical protein